MNNTIMKWEELEAAVVLHRKAYGLLLWLKVRMRETDYRLTAGLAEEFATGDLCARWVERNLGSFPDTIRPKLVEVIPFGYLLSSFLSTSFEVGAVGGWEA